MTQILKGVSITLAGSILYVCMGLFTKILGQHLIVNQIIFLQSIAGLVCASVLLRYKNYPLVFIVKQQNKMHFFRILMSLGAFYFMIAGIQKMSVFNALVIINSAPFVIPFLRKIFFKKHLPRMLLPAILLAFVGVILILAPDKGIFASAFFTVLLSMLCMSFSLVTLESQQFTNPQLTIFYYFFYSSIIMSIIIAFQDCVFNEWSAIGLLSGLMLFCLQASVIHAVKYISSQLIAVLYYFEIILSMLVSILFEGLIINQQIMIGTLLVIMGGLMVVLIEKKSLLQGEIKAAAQAEQPPLI